MNPIMCLVLALLCAFIGLFEYFRPTASREPLFWPVLGILIIEVCKSWVSH
jgi:hypothetical protein